MAMRGGVTVGLVLLALVAVPMCAPGDETTGPDVRRDADGSTGDGAIDGGDADPDGAADADADDDVVRPEIPDIEDEVCDEEGFDIARVIPDMLIVLDRSNSMAEDGYWNPVRDAIYEVTLAMDMEIWFGLMIFPNVSGGAVCSGLISQCEPGHEPIVGCGEGNAFPIRDALGAMATCGGTPIALTLQNARTYLDTLASDGHPKFVFLATDGAPNCNEALDGSTCDCTRAPSVILPNPCAANPGNCLDDARTFGVIDELRAAGIQIFVLGIGTSEWMDVLDEMAARGGTGGAFLAEDPATIRSTFEEIAGAIATCEFDMRSPSPEADPNLVNFYFDGDRVPRDDDGECDNGWRWTDATHSRVVFCGSYCEALLTHGVDNVSATWGCPTIII